MNIMKKQTIWQENILKKIVKKFFFFTLISLSFQSNISAKEKWKIDENISSVEFLLPVFLTTDVKGKFKNIDGFVEIDFDNQESNKAVFSVDLNSLEINYIKYRDLVLSNIFFDSEKYPLAIIDTRKFKYKEQTIFYIDVELTIKNISKNIPLEIKLNRLADELVQVTGIMEISRTDFNIGTAPWDNTAILKDNVKIKSNIFLFKE